MLMTQIKKSFICAIVFLLLSRNLIAADNKEFREWQKKLHTEISINSDTFNAVGIQKIKIIEVPSNIGYFKKSHYTAAAMFLQYHKLLKEDKPVKAVIASLSSYIYKCLCYLEQKEDSDKIGDGIKAYLESLKIDFKISEIIQNDTITGNKFFTQMNYVKEINNNNPVIITFITKQKMDPLHRINGFSVFGIGYILTKNREVIIIGRDGIPGRKILCDGKIFTETNLYLWNDKLYDNKIFVYASKNAVDSTPEKIVNVIPEKIVNSNKKSNTKDSNVFFSETIIPQKKEQRIMGDTLYFFYTPNCRICLGIEKKIKSKIKNNQNIKLLKYNIYENKNIELLNAFYTAYKVPQDLWTNKFSVFFRDKYFLTDELVDFDFEIKNDTLTAFKSPPPPLKSDLNSTFKSFGVWTIITAGLIDGINPCAFAVIIFFISYLYLVKADKIKILITGIFFTAGSFIAYFLIGFGMYKVLYKVSAISKVSKIINLSAGIFCAIIGIINLMDFFRAGKREFSKIKLKLPGSKTNFIHSIIRRQLKFKYFSVISFFTGFCISIIEFGCTGQIYLPIIMYMINNETMKNRAVFLLLIYTFMFVIPLIILFLLALTGASQKYLSELSKKNTAISKLLLAFILLFLAGFMLFKTGL